MPAGRRGAVLLEALVALAIVTIALTAAMSALVGVLHQQSILRQREEQASSAGKLLGVYSLLTRNQLDQRLGQQVIDSWVLRVQRPEKDLFRVAVSAADAPEHELAATVMYRPASR